MIKKLVREKTPALFKENEAEIITDKKELNILYSLKVKEELIEIQQANHTDIMEFVDLIDVAYSFAEQNGFSKEEIDVYRKAKFAKKGTFKNIALNNLNPNNPSNSIYFKHNVIQSSTAKGILNKHYSNVSPDGYQSSKQIDQNRYEASILAVDEVLSQLKSN